MKLLFLLALTATLVLAKSVNHLRQEECPVEDPAFLPAGPLNISLHPIFELFIGGTHGELNATGVSLVEANVDINAIALQLTLEISIPSIEVHTTYSSEGWIDARPLRQVTVPSGNFTGSGPVYVYATNIKVEADATLFINIIGNKVSIRILDIKTIQFGEVKVNLGTFVIAGETINWDTWSSGFVNNFNADWAAEKEAATEKIRAAANNVIGELTLQDLIDIITRPDEPCDP